MHIKQTFRNAGRIKEILTLASSYGFGHLIDLTHLSPVLGLSKKIFALGKAKRLDEYSEPVRLRMLLEELGPTFIKIGQFLSSRPDFMDEEYIVELSKLKDSVQPISFDLIEQQFIECFDILPDEMFESMEKEPIAAASIAQVHKAVLKNGEIVAVKIKRPMTKEVIEKDLAVILMFAGIAEKYMEEAKKYNIARLAEEFSDQLRKELDLILEANYMSKFREFFSADSNIIVPEVVWDCTSENILTMSYHDGMSIDALEALRDKNISLQNVAALGADFYLKQIFELGYFHGDPHSGNFVVTEQGKLVIFDFGIIGKIDGVLLDHISSLLFALIDFDVDAVLEEMVSYGIIEGELYSRKLRGDLVDVLLPVYSRDLKDLNLAKVMESILKLSHKYSFSFPPDYLLIFKTFMFMESVGLRLDPNFNFLKFAEPYAKKIILKRYNPKSMLKHSLGFTKDYVDVAERLPKDYRKLVDKVLQDKLTVNFMHQGLDKFSGEMDKSVNRLSFSILIAAIILASSMLVLAEIGPLVFGVPVFGLLGFLGAGVLGVGLAIAILKSGKL